MERRIDDQFHQNISRELGGIASTLQSVHNEIVELKEQAKIANHRTSKLEQWRENVQGKVVVLTTIVSLIVTTVITIFVKNI